MADDYYIAIHEAAHAVVGLLLGCPVESVTIESNVRVGSAGHSISWHGDPLSDMGGEDWNLMCRAVSSFAGHAATQRLGIDETYKEAGAENDYYNAAIAIDSISSGDAERYDSIRESALDMAQLAVELAWSNIEVVAESLVTERSLTAERIVQILG